MTVGTAAGVVIVGASLAGLTTAEGLRANGYRAPITLVGEENRAPYSRPPLSKQVLAGAWDVERTTLRDLEQLDNLGVRYLRGQRATAVDAAARTITVGGVVLPFEHLVAATGVTARTLRNPHRVRGIHSLRTIDDVLALRRDLDGADRVAVVGAGVLGCEIAAAVRSAGHDVTLIGRTARFAQAGGQLSTMIAALLQENGVRMRIGSDVSTIETSDTANSATANSTITSRTVDGHGTVSALRLTDGSVVRADVVIAAIGCSPVVGWLSGAGIDISDGVLCDANGVAAPGIYAVGDVARWLDPLTGEARRIEHQASAIERAHALARFIVTGESTPPIAAFFWSELFGNRILVHGRLDPDLPLTVLAGDPADRRFVGATIRRGWPTGLVGWNMPREFRVERARLIHQSGMAAEANTEANTETRQGSAVA
ncbi:MAG TPA: FAD/NAD(P)-binding oxidoreductase [Microbacteriaceae bacterium]|nr:FAD/NAD(P)-binding oxidoreductase [Microbacteriaceae bacterium]